MSLRETALNLATLGGVDRRRQRQLVTELARRLQESDRLVARMQEDLGWRLTQDRQGADRGPVLQVQRKLCREAFRRDPYVKRAICGPMYAARTPPGICPTNG